MRPTTDEARVEYVCYCISTNEGMKNPSVTVTCIRINCLNCFPSLACTPFRQLCACSFSRSLEFPLTSRREHGSLCKTPLPKACGEAFTHSGIASCRSLRSATGEAGSSKLRRGGSDL